MGTVRSIVRTTDEAPEQAPSIEAESPRKAWRFTLSPLTAFSVGSTLVYAILCALVRSDLRSGRIALEALAGPMNLLVRLGTWWNPKVLDPTAFATGLALLIAGLALWHQRSSLRPSSWRFAVESLRAPLAVGVILVSHAWIVEGLFLRATVGILAALSVVAFVCRRSKGTLATFEAEAAPFAFKEAGWLFGVTFVGMLLRLYAIERVPYIFDGEMAVFAAAGTTVTGSFEAMHSTSAPWSPNGILFYLPLLVVHQFFDTGYVAMRIANSAVGILTIPILYFAVRSVGGRAVSLLAAALLAIDPIHTMWGRWDVFPHNGTAWPMILCGLATVMAIRKPTTRRMILVSLSMALTWHQYPSGQSGALVAPLLFFAQGARDPEFRRRHWRTCFATLAVGSVLWFLGQPFVNAMSSRGWLVTNPFTMTGPRAAWTAQGEESASQRVSRVARSIGKETVTFLDNAWYRTRAMTHQDLIIPLDPVRPRVMSLVVAAFGVLGALLTWLAYWRGRVPPLFLAVAFSGALPAIASNAGNPKRGSAFFPAWDALAAIGIVWTVAAIVGFVRSRNGGRLLTVVAMGWILAVASLASLYFSGRHFPFKRPPDASFLERIQAEVKPRTVIAIDLFDGGGWGGSKPLYGLVSTLVEPSRRPNALVGPMSRYELAHAVEDGDIDVARLSRRGIHNYLWTPMRDQVQETEAFRDWNRLLYLFADTPGPARVAMRAELERRCGPPQQRVDRTETGWLEPVLFFSCPLPTTTASDADRQR